MKTGSILTYQREPGLTKPYCAQVWQESNCLAIDTFETAQAAYDWCVEQGATTIDCEIYGDD